MAKRPYFSCFWGLSAVVAFACTAAGCGGSHEPAATASEVAAKPTAEADADLEGLVVGTIGRDHLTKDGYPLTKIADIIGAFKPDTILIQIRPDAFKQQHLEDASFEMTYVNGVAGTAGVDTVPIDWFKDEDMLPPGSGGDDAAPAPPKKGKKGAKPEPVDTSGGDAKKGGAGFPDPFNFVPAVVVDPDNADAYKTEAGFVNTLGPLKFEDANSEDTTQKISDSFSAQVRYTKGYSATARRIAWLSYNATQAYMKQKGNTHRLMVVVNVRYRAAMELTLKGFGAVILDPVAIAKTADPHDSIPEDVITQWHRQIDRLHDAIPKHGPETLKQNLLQKIAILQAAIDKRGGCCVDASAIVVKDDSK